MKSLDSRSESNLVCELIDRQTPIEVIRRCMATGRGYVQSGAVRSRAGKGISPKSNVIAFEESLIYILESHIPWASSAIIEGLSRLRCSQLP
jgi:hypothetical protein